jgi:hypothetical protein
MDHSRLVVRSSIVAAPILSLGLCLSPGLHASLGARFLVVNESPYVIEAVYASRPRVATWGSNLIDRRVLKPGSSAVLDLAEGCGVYDLRFVAPDGIEFLEDEVPFCGDDAEEAAAAASGGSPQGREDVVRLGADVVTKTTRARSAGSSDAGEGGR